MNWQKRNWEPSQALCYRLSSSLLVSRHIYVALIIRRSVFALSVEFIWALFLHLLPRSTTLSKNKLREFLTMICLSWDTPPCMFSILDASRAFRIFFLELWINMLVKKIRSHYKNIHHSFYIVYLDSMFIDIKNEIVANNLKIY